MVTIHEEGARAHSPRSLLQTFVEHGLKELEKTGDVALIFVTEERSFELNRKYRGKDRATNVLSFPSNDESSLGDIVITSSLVKREASDRNIEPLEHEQRLILHGLLHLGGFTHDTDNDAVVMEQRENEIYTAFIND